MAIPVHSLSPKFDSQVRASLLERGVNLEEPRELSKHVKQLSDFFIAKPGEATPWEQPFAIPAYLAYFQPLNFIRLRAAFEEVKRFLPNDSYSQIWDFGSGLGTTQWVLENEETIEPRAFYAIESSKRASELHRDLAKHGETRWHPQFSKLAEPNDKALAVFSYSFLEMQNQLPDLTRFAHLLIVEPSTREGGRDLMAARARLMEQGFTPLAPCTHSKPCPLLTQSTKDWCHMRVHFSPPHWFAALEEYLPMKNRTLTYSYLLMSRTVADTQWRDAARAVGDTLEENGKTRQMICRGPKREFLSWLHRFGEPPEIPHGALIRGVDSAEEKSGELRAKPDSLTWEV